MSIRGISQTARKLLFAIGIVAVIFNLCIVIGAHFWGQPRVSPSELRRLAEQEDYADKVNPDEVLELSQDAPPGRGIPAMVVLDGLLVFAAVLMGLPFLFTHQVLAKVQGVLTLVASILALLAGIVLLILNLVELLLMVGLFLAAPFGTIAYFALYGFFDTNRAAVLLGAMLFFKLAGAGCFVVAFPRFLGNKAMVLLLVTSLVGGLLLGFLHGMVPSPLVGMTDALGAVIVLILGLLWSLFFLIRGLISILRLIL